VKTDRPAAPRLEHRTVYRSAAANDALARLATSLDLIGALALPPLLLCLGLFPAAAGAAERDFASTWTTRTLAPGQVELEAWLTGRIARVTDDQAWTDLRAAAVWGLEKHFEAQAALDVTVASTTRTAVPEPRLTGLLRWAPLKSDEVLGLGGLARASVGFDALELEVRLVADRQLGKLLLGVNAAATRRLLWGGRTGVDTRLEETVGVRYAIGAQASFGLELRLQSAFLASDYQGTGIYVGPTFAVRGDGFWVSLGAQAQVAADKAPADRGNGQPLELRDNERFQLRLAVGTRALN
jgi:hypothetical protein